MDNQDDDAKCRALLKEISDVKGKDFVRIHLLLTRFRILSRSKNISHQAFDDSKCVDILIELCKLGHKEAQKSLSNLMLNYEHLREQIAWPHSEHLIDRLNQVLNTYKHRDSNDEKTLDEESCNLLSHDFRITFLVTALCAGTRPKLHKLLASQILQLLDQEAELISERNTSLIIECLRTLFNLTMDKKMDENLNATVINKLLSNTHEDRVPVERRTTILANTIHLLTNMTEKLYQLLDSEHDTKILEYLDERLKYENKESFRETVLPALNVCTNICRYKKTTRDVWFEDIFGKTKDFDKRPEEYDTIRGRLVKLMTSVDVHIKNIAAEFLYTLAGEDAEKLITYTGFGNSAAFLAQHGLISKLGSSQDANTVRVRDGEEHGDSYLELRQRIDPITGKLETHKQDPMAGMSEEEKEYHAHELSNAIAKLTKLGVMRPMSVSEDGQVREVHPDSSLTDELTEVVECSKSAKED